MKPSGVITITTDFGHKGPFAAVMKGVILGRFHDFQAKLVIQSPSLGEFDLTIRTIQQIGSQAFLKPGQSPTHRCPFQAYCPAGP